jgi:NADH dehydrogenase
MKVLVLGGSGFLGRHVVAALLDRGHAAVIGTRDPRRLLSSDPATMACERRRVRFERMGAFESWDATLKGIDAVVNCVGILRPRGRATYDRVHRLAPVALAGACARLEVRRLIHVSALGLHSEAHSGFVRSKLAGEHALLASGNDISIVRPSLLDGNGGYGARWIRQVARWPVHCIPADACGRIAVLDVRDAGAAIAALCEKQGGIEWREVDLGGNDAWSMADYLAATRAAAALPPVRQVRVPAWCARIASHFCDLLHLTPFSFGHLELLRRDNLPRPNRLPALLGRSPTPVAQRRRSSRAEAQPQPI